MKTYNDVFVEELVVRHRPGLMTLMRIGMLAAGVVLVVAFYFLTGSILGEYGAGLFPALFALVCIGVFLGFRFLSLEYEYAFFSGDVDIDRIRGKRKRTRLMSFNCRDVELMAPYGPQYESIVAGKFDKTIDVRGNGKGQRDWFIICKNQAGERTVMAFSPSERMIDAFRQFVRKGNFKEE